MVRSREKLRMLGIQVGLITEHPFREDLNKLEELYSFSEIQDKFRNDWDNWVDYADDVNRSNRSDGKGIPDGRYGTWEDKLGNWNSQNEEFSNTDTFSNTQSNFSGSWSSWSDLENAVSGSITDYSNWENHMDVFYGDFSSMSDAFVSDYTSWDDFLSDFIIDGSIFIDWDAHEHAFLNSFEDYSDFRALFPSSISLSSEREVGSQFPSAGVRVHEEEGTTKDGYTIEAGSLELYGNEVHISGSDIGDLIEESVDYSNLQASDTSPTVGDAVDFTADVRNLTSNTISVSVELKASSEVVENQVVELQAYEQRSVTLTHERPFAFGCDDFQIGNSNTVEVCWSPNVFIP